MRSRARIFGHRDGLSPKLLFAAGAMLCLLAAPGAAAAVDISVSVPRGGRPWTEIYNPRAADGLLAVASETSESSFADTGVILGDPSIHIWSSSEQASFAAAAYGSDSSIDGIGNPRLLGYAVEPMADVVGSVSGVVTWVNPELSWSTRIQTGGQASASIAVKHRVIARAIPDLLKPLLEPLTVIPVVVHYSLSAGMNGNRGDVSDAYGSKAEFFIADETGVLLQHEVSTAKSLPLDEQAGTISTVARRSTVDETYIYTITAKASTFPMVSSPNEAPEGVRYNAEGYAVVDPFVAVDPSWEYSQYFMVQQESLRVPGEWVEVTRKWQKPEPGDVDGDKVISLADAVLCLRVLSGKTEAVFKRADVNADGRIGLGEALYILQKVAGMR